MDATSGIDLLPIDDKSRKFMEGPLLPGFSVLTHNTVLITMTKKVRELYNNRSLSETQGGERNVLCSQ